MSRTGPLLPSSDRLLTIKMRLIVICKSTHTVYCFISPAIITLPQSKRKRNRIYLSKKKNQDIAHPDIHLMNFQPERKRKEI
jgi:hypothetical protein